MSSCKQTVSQYERSRGVDCSERISKLALPNLHVVSSVLKDHFRTLRKEQIQRLENLIKQIQDNHIPSVSQLCLMNTLNKYKHCNQRRIKDVLDGIDRRTNIAQTGMELSQARLSPIKSSSDSLLIGLRKQISFNNKNDKSAGDLSASLSPFKGGSKRAFSSINWNFRETVLIQVEGFSRTDVEQNSKSIQTESTKSEIEEECSEDISVLYVQKNNHKKSKLRQLHTLLEGNGILQNQTDCECQTAKRNKSNKSLMKIVELNDDVKITINHLCSLYVLVITYLNYLLNALQILNLSLQNGLCELKPYVQEIPNVLYEVFLDCKTQIVQLSLEACDKILQTFCLKTGDSLIKQVKSEEQQNNRKKKKRRPYYTETYHFSNIKSIIH